MKIKKPIEPKDFIIGINEKLCPTVDYFKEEDGKLYMKMPVFNAEDIRLASLQIPLTSSDPDITFSDNVIDNMLYHDESDNNITITYVGVKLIDRKYEVGLNLDTDELLLYISFVYSFTNSTAGNVHPEYKEEELRKIKEEIDRK